MMIWYGEVWCGVHGHCQDYVSAGVPYGVGWFIKTLFMASSSVVTLGGGHH